MAKLRDIQLGTSKLLPFSFERQRGDGSRVPISIVLRVLSKREMDLARANAETTVKDLKVKEGRSFDELFEEAKIVEILAIACRDPEKPEQPWASPLELASSLTAGEITLLWEAYTKHQDECSPILSDIKEEEFEALVDMIAKEGDTAPLVSFAWPLRNAFIITLARQLVTCRTQISASTSASTNLSSESSTDSERSAATSDYAADIQVLHDRVAELTLRIVALEPAPPATE